jgi:hypothetical protein
MPPLSEWFSPDVQRKIQEAAFAERKSAMEEERRQQIAALGRLPVRIVQNAWSKPLTARDRHFLKSIRVSAS